MPTLKKERGETIERTEAEASANDEADIWEKAEKTRKAKAKADAETVERARAWAKEKAKEKV